MTQKRLAELIEVSETTISKYESNIAFPPFDKLRTLSAVLGVSLDELCGTQAKETLSLYNLTENQKLLVKNLVDEFRLNSKTQNKKISSKQYELLGRIISEFSI